MKVPNTVLIPSNDPAFLPVIAELYSSLGYNVFYGKSNLYSEYCQPSIVHLLWPEEFTDNIKQVCDHEIQRFRDAIIAKKKSGAYVIHSCNNLTPHTQLNTDQQEAVETLFREVIGQSDLIHYFSEYSRQAYEMKYPNAASKNSVVTRGFNYSHLVKKNHSNTDITNRNGAKRFLIFGAIRNTGELNLLNKAWTKVQNENVSLILVARYLPQSTGSRLKRFMQKIRFHWFLKKFQIDCETRFINDSEIQAVMDRSDALIVLRDNSLSSGLPLLGMTFGKLIIAPNLPTIKEYLDGTSNILYEVGDYRALSEAIMAAKNIDIAEICNQNISISRSFDLFNLKKEVSELNNIKKKY
jgi:hypothetical protein